jgi:putative transposase
MNEDAKMRIQVFDPEQPYCVVYRRLPHWSQAGTICFITWRTWDSIPEAVLHTWLGERAAWLRHHGIDPSADDWQTRLQQLKPELLSAFKLYVSDRWNDHLDACHGACVLRRPVFSKEVADSLRHFDGDRYDLTDFIVMPNHVHVLVAFPDEASMLRQCESWKHFTATRINRALKRRGRFWQQDGFDHLVRSTEQFDYLRRYIADNPSRAKLHPGEFVHESKPV